MYGLVWFWGGSQTIGSLTPCWWTNHLRVDPWARWPCVPRNSVRAFAWP
jgi:hypothetical protein